MEIKKDLFVIRKVLMAKDLKDAVKREREGKITDVYMDEEWKKDKTIKSEKVGF